MKLSTSYKLFAEFFLNFYSLCYFESLWRKKNDLSGNSVHMSKSDSVLLGFHWLWHREVSEFSAGASSYGLCSSSTIVPPHTRTYRRTLQQISTKLSHTHTHTHTQIPLFSLFRFWCCRLEEFPVPLKCFVLETKLQGNTRIFLESSGAWRLASARVAVGELPIYGKNKKNNTSTFKASRWSKEKTGTKLNSAISKNEAECLWRTGCTAKAVSPYFPTAEDFVRFQGNLYEITGQSGTGTGFSPNLPFHLSVLFHRCSISTHVLSGKWTMGPLAATVSQRRNSTIATIGLQLKEHLSGFISRECGAEIKFQNIHFNSLLSRQHFVFTRT
jgi:hypothetical protein